jgi:hypothetical protein
MGDQELTIAVVGCGPRGISVLERLAARLTARQGHRSVRRLRIYVVDETELGAGRVWRTDQPDWFTMNTVIGQVTMYSGEPDGGPARPGAGPSLGQWLAEQGTPADHNDYAPRVVYGRYLRSVFDTVAAALPAHCELVPVRATVTRIDRYRGGFVLALSGDHAQLRVDRVVLATGHPRTVPDEDERRWLAFAADHPGLRYLCGDSAADLELDEVSPGTPVGVKGIGLSFYDVMLALTVGRGGRFATGPDGALTYLPSGREPVIVAGSRSGLPIPARGANQKAPTEVHRGAILTSAAIDRARARSVRRTGSDQLDFAEDVRPLVELEVELVYLTAVVRRDRGPEAAAEFDRRFTAAAAHGAAARREVRRRFGVAGVAAPDLAALARPFAGQRFGGPAEFHARLLDVLRTDLGEAALGNVEGPLKAALDALRDIRNLIREAVDFGGLRPGSFAGDFLGRYVPVNSLLSAGPPIARVRQLVALIEAGVVHVVGPDARFGTDAARGTFTVSSPWVAGSAREVTTVVDARIPKTDVRRDASALLPQMLRDGLAREYVAVDRITGELLPTGGLDVTRAPYHALRAGGDADPDLYALGIPTEHTRWFTQVGSSRPGSATLFYADADAIAADLLCPCAGTEERGLAPASPAVRS